MPQQGEAKRGKSGSHLGVFATLEEGGYPDQANGIVPHDLVSGFIVWDLECVLEHCI